MWPVEPLNGESLLSWVVRTAEDNHLPDCYTLLRSAGSEYHNTPLMALIAFNDAAAIANVLAGDPGEVERRMFRQCVPGFVTVRGIHFRTISLVVNRRRFSPTTLRHRGVHMTAWMLRTMPFCPESWEYLQDSCHECGAVQAWRKARDPSRCDHCAADLSTHKAEVVDTAIREPLATLAAIVGGDPESLRQARQCLPATLQTLDAAELWELTLTVASLVDVDLPGWVGANPSVADHQGLTRSIADAWRLLERYPTSIVDALWDAKTTLDDVRRARFIRRLSAILRGDDRDHSLPGVRSALGALQSLIAGDGGDVRNVLVKPAARLLGVTETDIAHARDDGSLSRTNAMSNGRVLFNLDRKEIEWLASVRRDRLSPSEIGLRFGIPPYAVRQLIRDGLLGVQDHPWLIRTYGRPQATEADLADLTRRLRSKSVPLETIERPILLPSAMRGFGGGIKPWAGVFRRLLTDQGEPGGEGGRIAFSLCRELRALSISIEDARSCWRMTPEVAEETYSQFDGVDILNLALKKSSILRRFGTDVGKHKKWLLSGPLMAAVAAQNMTFAELIVRTGLTTAGIRTALLARDVNRYDDFGWPRDQVLTQADDIVWRPSTL